LAHRIVERAKFARMALAAGASLLVWMLLAPGAAAAKKHPPSKPIDLNVATVKELEELAGIGPTTANAIIQFRTKSGRFRRGEDLLAVRGISEAKLEKLPSLRHHQPAAQETVLAANSSASLTRFCIPHTIAVHLFPVDQIVRTAMTRKCIYRAGVLPVFVAALALAAGIAPVIGSFRARAAAAPAIPDASGYHLLKKIQAGGEGFWDYLTFDSPTRRLFISRGTKVVVLNVDTEKVVGEIPNTPGVHGIALAPDLGRGFTSNGAAGTVTIFDLKTLAVIGQLQAGTNPDAIVYDPASRRVFAMNGRSSDATVIDAASGGVAATIPVGGKPEFAVADGAGHIYANIEDHSEILQIDAQKLTVTARWPLAPCQEPSGLAMDVQHRRLFAGCANKMMAVANADTGKVVATPAIGEGVDANAFDPGTDFAFASNGRSGTLTVVHEDAPDKFTVVEDVPTQLGARTMVLDPKTHEVYLVTASLGPPPTPTASNPRPFPTLVPDSFVVLVFGR